MTAEPQVPLIVHHVTDRLMRAHPALDEVLVRQATLTAYEELKYARVRTYLPVLMERRARDLLALHEGD
ncbi:three-helix bundle dimerization domain-containing protein [Streptomyces sp. NPDC048551]|uniref:three-helix bundle dimerization domain-containing protein n=1 Tax=Streptomyces sp. NPDC048551 TaxID=3155758 RepID=UPI0034433AA7